MDAAPEAKRLPVKTIRIGDCSASVWAREVQTHGEPKRFYSVTLERSYKDRDGAWRYAKSFDADSLGSVSALCERVSEFLATLQKQDDQAKAA